MAFRKYRTDNKFHSEYTTVLFVVPANKLANANFKDAVRELQSSGVIVRTLDVTDFPKLKSVGPEAF